MISYTSDQMNSKNNRGMQLSDKKLDQVSDLYFKKHGFRLNLCAKILAETMSGGLLLDVGTDGHLARYRNLLGSDFRLCGVDHLEWACQRALAAGYEVVKKADLEEGLPFPDEYFDGVFAGEVLEHILHTDLLLNEIYRILKPGGFLLVTTPNLCYLVHILLILQGKQFGEVRHKHRLDIKDHVSYFSPEALVAELKMTGFIKIALHPYQYPRHSLLWKLLFNSSRRLQARHNPYLVASAHKP